MHRIQAAKNSNFQVTKYAKSTGTNILRKHLYKFHIKEWVKQCDEKGIAISGEEAQAAVAEYREECGESLEGAGVQGSQTRQRFTSENFVNALIKFVVSDDQVCTIHSKY